MINFLDFRDFFYRDFIDTNAYHLTYYQIQKFPLSFIEKKKCTDSETYFVGTVETDMK